MATTIFRNSTGLWEARGMVHGQFVSVRFFLRGCVGAAAAETENWIGRSG